MIKHLAVIMDGNRRWAKQQGMQAWFGHQQGTQAVETIISFCLDHTIPFLTLYAFSLENFKRPLLEKEFLFNLIIAQAEKKLPQFIENNIKIRFVGDRSLFPATTQEALNKVEQETAHGSKLCIDFLFCYGGQQEIIAATQKIIHATKEGSLNPQELTPELFSQYLWNYGMPSPDLIIRTGGKQRLSNFLTFQSAYSELYFIDTLWPDITRKELEAAYLHYTQSIRNFGA